MKINFIIFFLLSNYAFSQKMYSIKYKSQADVKLFVVEYESQADLNVFKEKYKSNAKGNEGLWYFVEYQSVDVLDISVNDSITDLSNSYFTDISWKFISFNTVGDFSDNLPFI